jgi:hypothetical protein
MSLRDPAALRGANDVKLKFLGCAAFFALSPRDSEFELDMHSKTVQESCDGLHLFGPHGRL